LIYLKIVFKNIAYLVVIPEEVCIPVMFSKRTVHKILLSMPIIQTFYNQTQQRAQKANTTQRLFSVYSTYPGTWNLAEGQQLAILLTREITLMSGS
jgi:hypothetical protein